MNNLISRQAAIDAVEKSMKLNPHEDTRSKLVHEFEHRHFIKILIDLPSAEPEYSMDEWCTDCKEYDNEKKCCPRFNRVISEALKEAEPEPTYEQVKRYCNRRGLSIVESALLVKNQSVEPEWNNHKDVPDNNEDVISRQAAKQKLISFISETNMSDIYPGINNAISLVVDKLPSVEPERKTGKWLINSDGYYPYCSNCKNEPTSRVMTDFCDHCGADMRGKKDED